MARYVTRKTGTFIDEYPADYILPQLAALPCSQSKICQRFDPQHWWHAGLSTLVAFISSGYIAPDNGLLFTGETGAAAVAARFFIPERTFIYEANGTQPAVYFDAAIRGIFAAASIEMIHELLGSPDCVRSIASGAIIFAVDILLQWINSTTRDEDEASLNEIFSWDKITSDPLQWLRSILLTRWGLVLLLLMFYAPSTVALVGGGIFLVGQTAVQAAGTVISTLGSILKGLFGVFL